MGLSDRFKDEKKKSSAKKTEKKADKAADKKIEKKSAYPSHVQADLEMLEDIECMVLNKIAYTPVWFEFTEDEQKKLIRDYLNARLALPENAALILTEDEKDIFVTRILASV